MATLAELVYDFKNLMKGGLTSDDTDISNEQVAHWIHTERAVLLKLYIEKNKRISDSIKQVIPCLEVECRDVVECCSPDQRGIFSDIKVLVTKKEIPDPLYADLGDLYNPALITYVGTVDDKQSFEFTSKTIVRYSKYHKYQHRIPQAYYINKKIYITKIQFPSQISLIKLEGIFYDPDKVNDVNACGPCFSYDEPYPIIPELISPLKDIVLKKYLPLAMNKQTHDYKNNARDN